MRTTTVLLAALLTGVIVAQAQNTVVFDNQSSEPALVKLIGPTSSEIEVPDGSKQALQALAGKYFIKVRYGVHGKYHYTKGQEFTVDETATTTSEITITLHKVVNGNYDSRPINEQEFGVAHPAAATPSRDAKENKSKEIGDAADSGDLQKVKTLLNDNPDLVSSKDDKNGQTPLYMTAKEGHKEIALLLLTKKAEVNAKAKNGATPLHAAAGQGHKDVAELLISFHADVNAEDNSGFTPLLMAVANGHKEVAELLLANKANINAKANKHGWTPLYVAANNGDTDMVQLLLLNGADVNAEANDGATPMQRATALAHRNVAELLRLHGGRE